MQKYSIMTHKERILAAISREEVDYTPCILGFYPLRKSIINEPMLSHPHRTNTGTSDISKYNWEQQDLPRILQFHIPTKRMHKDTTVITWKQDDLIYKQYDTPAGSIRAAMQYSSNQSNDDTSIIRSGTAHFKDKWVTSEKDLECMRYVLKPWEPDRDEFTKLKMHFRRLSKYAEKNNLPIATTYGMGTTLCLQNILPEKLCIKSVVNPYFLHEFLEMEHLCNMKTIEIVADLGVDIINNKDRLL